MIRKAIRFRISSEKDFLDGVEAIFHLFYCLVRAKLLISAHQRLENVFLTMETKKICFFFFELL